MNILVTGGAGFIGSCLVRRLLDEGHEVVIVDNFSTASRGNRLCGASFVEGDIGVSETLGRLPDFRYDAVCHLAAQSSGAVSMERPVYDLNTNALSTLHLIRWCSARGVPRFVYASSMAVYGNPDAVPVSERSPLAPVSYYGVSKLMSEHLLGVAARSGLSVTALRMFNVYGPGQNMANLRQGMASIYLTYMLKGVTIPMTGSLDRFRDFVYIDDVINVWMLALKSPRTPSMVYNIGSGRATTVRELVGLLGSALGHAEVYPVDERPAPPGDQFGLYSDSSLAARDLGWRARIPLVEGLRTMVSWARRSATA